MLRVGASMSRQDCSRHLVRKTPNSGFHSAQCHRVMNESREISDLINVWRLGVGFASQFLAHETLHHLRLWRSLSNITMATTTDIPAQKYQHLSYSIASILATTKLLATQVPHSYQHFSYNIATSILATSTTQQLTHWGQGQLPQNCQLLTPQLQHS